MCVPPFLNGLLAKIEGATSAEFDENAKHQVINLMEEQKKIVDKGGTMRLGAYACNLKKGSIVRKLYGQDEIRERHRHRYEFNNDYKEELEAKGLSFTGMNEKRGLVEIIENDSHPFFVAVQFHPEFKSQPTNPHPLFKGFVRACLDFSVAE